MRTDYKYIASAVNLILSTTEKGHKYIDELYSKSEKIDNAEGIDELLLLLEDSYIIIPNESGIDEWVKLINDVYSEEYRATNEPLTSEHILESIKLGYVGFRIAIWDDKNILNEHKEPSEIFRITIPKNELNELKETFIESISEINIINRLLCIESGRVEQLVDGNYQTEKVK